MMPLQTGRASLALLGAAAANAGLGLALALWPTARAAVFALLPAVVVALAALVASNRTILIFGAFALDLSGIQRLQEPLIGGSIFASDVLLLLAVGSWAAAWLISPGGRRPSWPRSPLLGWPFLLFATFIAIGVVRGHERWGLSLFSQPLRFVLCAAIAFAVADLRPGKAWQGLTVVFYLGAIWSASSAVYYLATGTVQKAAAAGLSTGGFRVLSLTTALYLTGALVLALLNFEREQLIRRRFLHLFVGVLAGFGIAVAYGRGIFYAVAAVLIALLLTRSQLRGAILLVLPLCLPAIVLGALIVGHAAPGFAPKLAERVTTTNDPSTQWRSAARSAIWRQVREDPLLGVGFGKGATFTVGMNQTRFEITQDPHNSYLFLWAGGGIVTLASFLLLYLIFVWDCWRRYRSQRELPRLLIAWCVSVWFCFALNALVEPALTQPNLILVFWVLMLIPACVPYPKGPDRTQAVGTRVYRQPLRPAKV